MLLRLSSLLSLACLLCAPLLAQKPPGLELHASIRSRVEIWNWFSGASNSSYAFSGNLARLTLRRQRTHLDWQIDWAAPILAWLPSNSIAALPQGPSGLGAFYYAANGNRRTASLPFLKQAFLTWKIPSAGSRPALQIGRFEWFDGIELTPEDPTLAALKRDRVNQRLLGPFLWTHVGRSFDGVHFSRASSNIRYAFLAALPTRGAFQVDGWGNLKIGLLSFSASAPTRWPRQNGEWRLAAIYYHDWRRVLKVDNRPLAERSHDLASIRLTTLGGHYLHRWQTARGAFSGLAWLYAQLGRWGRLDHRAYAANLEAGWEPPAFPQLRPWLAAGLARSSGDPHPADARHSTFFQLLPTPRPFARTPFFNMMNTSEIFAMLTLRPSPRLSTRTEFHSLRLTQPADLWYAGGGPYQPWSFGYLGRNAAGARSLANLWDASLDWQLSPSWSFSAYFGYIDGKSAVRAVYPQGPTGRFSYLELTWRF